MTEVEELREQNHRLAMALNNYRELAQGALDAALQDACAKAWTEGRAAQNGDENPYEEKR